MVAAAKIFVPVADILVAGVKNLVDGADICIAGGRIFIRIVAHLPISVDTQRFSQYAEAKISRAQTTAINTEEGAACPL
ncbi:MAG: hypothetical protein AB3X44_05830 [Leptothrix sp. (in: b-proteobacteria)]